MASIKDIAKACGVSVATVSKALNGHSDISQATKEKVRQAADKLGYMPNSAARALKTNRTYNLGVLFVDDAQSGLTHECWTASNATLRAGAMTSPLLTTTLATATPVIWSIAATAVWTA